MKAALIILGLIAFVLSIIFNEICSSTQHTACMSLLVLGALSVLSGIIVPDNSINNL